MTISVLFAHLFAKHDVAGETGQVISQHQCIHIGVRGLHPRAIDGAPFVIGIPIAFNIFPVHSFVHHATIPFPRQSREAPEAATFGPQVLAFLLAILGSFFIDYCFNTHTQNHVISTWFVFIIRSIYHILPIGPFGQFVLIGNLNISTMGTS